MEKNDITQQEAEIIANKLMGKSDAQIDFIIATTARKNRNLNIIDNIVKLIHDERDKGGFNIIYLFKVNKSNNSHLTFDSFTNIEINAIRLHFESKGYSSITRSVIEGEKLYISWEYAF